ncbi:hypothetical protein R5R35_004344 [Gryllus longicercus]|uniref:Odorant binding protein n=1 Tax=Gryllus longicercus TaxID=2509291 RepID=A0AAN9VEH9_9ORTH
MALGNGARVRMLVLCALFHSFVADVMNTGKTETLLSTAGRIQTRRKRGEDPEEEQFCCWFPWNGTMVQPYITCGILDRRQKRPYGVPVYSDAGEPNFSEATYCRNGSAAATTTSAPATDDSEEDAVLCTATPSDDCRIRCIYSTTGVLNAQRRPRKRRLAMHWIKRLNSTAGFEVPIKQAVDLCLSLHDRLIQENGTANVDMCVLQTQLHYCIEENVGRYCPRRFRTRMVVDEVCEEP